MTTLTELKRLAEAAVSDWSNAMTQALYREATPPDVVLRLLAVIKAADKMRYVMAGPVGGPDGMYEPPYQCCRDYDAARAALGADHAD